MMSATRKSTSSNTQPGRGAGRPPHLPERRARERITAAHRWLLISQNAYGRAQQRGFVGGDPLADLSEATREIDEKYAADLHGLLALKDPAELVEQFRSLFASYGLGQQALDRVLEMNRDSLEKLAESNRRLRNGAAERVARRTSVLQGAAEDAMHTLKSLTGVTPDADDIHHLIEQPGRVVRNSLQRLGALAESAGHFAEAGSGKNRGKGKKTARAPDTLELHGAVIKAYEGLTAAELAEAPVAALRGVSTANSKKLKSAFRMHTIRDMAASKLIGRAEGVVTLADSENEARAAGKSGRGSSSRQGGLADIADGRVDRLEGVTRHQAKVLKDAFGIKTVRDLAGNRFFRVARAIVTLAELEK